MTRGLLGKEDRQESCIYMKRLICLICAITLFFGALTHESTEAIASEYIAVVTTTIVELGQASAVGTNVEVQTVAIDKAHSKDARMILSKADSHTIERKLSTAEVGAGNPEHAREKSTDTRTASSRTVEIGSGTVEEHISVLVVRKALPQIKTTNHHEHTPHEEKRTRRERSEDQEGPELDT